MDNRSLSERKKREVNTGEGLTVCSFNIADCRGLFVLLMFHIHTNTFLFNMRENVFC